MIKKLLLMGLAFIGLTHAAGSNDAGNAQVYNSQQAVTGTATALANQALKTICVKALHANTIPVYIGNSTVATSGSSGGMELQADQSYCAAVVNANQIYVIATTTGASVSWIGTN